MENSKIRLLIVDDEDAFRELLVRRFDRNEFEVTGCGSGEEALTFAKSRSWDVGVIDIRMPGISGIELLQEIKVIHPNFEAIMLTGQATIDSAIQAMKFGAYDYLAKPCKLFELEIIIRKAYEKKMLAERNEQLNEELKRRMDDVELVGSSDAVNYVREQVNRVAATEEPALIQGEHGSGKQLIAQLIHKSSSRSDSAFVTVNCGVLSEGMLEMELFGHVANAFVGAGSRKRGLLERCDGGAVLLAEVEQIPSSMQVKILSFLDTGEFRMAGGVDDISVNTRLLFSTTEDLRRLTQNGTFREEFFYKISTLNIVTPPLRDHKEDIPEIAEFIIKNSRIVGGREKKLARKAIEALMKYSWPSNVRELTNVIERAMTLTPKNLIQMKDLPISFEKKSKTHRQRHLLSLAEIEKEHILHVLDAVNSNISKAARILGISRPKLYRKLERYNTAKGV
jgi:DNA-binding NtrC family response regulator